VTQRKKQPHLSGFVDQTKPVISEKEEMSDGEDLWSWGLAGDMGPPQKNKVR